jgi:hypothetical protein
MAENLKALLTRSIFNLQPSTLNEIWILVLESMVASTMSHFSFPTTRRNGPGSIHVALSASQPMIDILAVPYGVQANAVTPDKKEPFIGVRSSWHYASPVFVANGPSLAVK